MELSRKQKIGQSILAHHNSINIERVTLLYTERPEVRKTEKACIIVSISKKIAPKAVQRNYNKRVLRAVLRELPKEILLKYDWMWICKEQLMTKELLLEIKRKVTQLAKQYA